MTPPAERCWHGHAGHVHMLDVDAYDVLSTACRFPDGAYCGDLKIYGETTPERAAAVRRAEKAYWRSRGVRR